MYNLELDDFKTEGSVAKLVKYLGGVTSEQAAAS